MPPVVGSWTACAAFRSYARDRLDKEINYTWSPISIDQAFPRRRAQSQDRFSFRWVFRWQQSLQNRSKRREIEDFRMQRGSGSHDCERWSTWRRSGAAPIPLTMGIGSKTLGVCSIAFFFSLSVSFSLFNLPDFRSALMPRFFIDVVRTISRLISYRKHFGEVRGSGSETKNETNKRAICQLSRLSHSFAWTWLWEKWIYFSSRQLFIFFRLKTNRAAEKGKQKIAFALSTRPFSNNNNDNH